VDTANDVPNPVIEHPETLILLVGKLLLDNTIDEELPLMLPKVPKPPFVDAGIAVGTVIDPVAVATTFAPDGAISIVTVPALTLVTPNKTTDRITNNLNRISCIGNLM
jgi:hypothetical protein